MKKTETTAPKLTGDMLLIDIVALCPSAEKVLSAWGLNCVGCGGSALETLSQGARGHGFGEEEVTALLEDVNTAFDESPQMPSDVTITEPAAREFAKIAAGEGKTDQILRIVTDGKGGFCLEFETEPKHADPSFANPAVPEISVRVSPLILRRVGGATIDWKNGRFALDLMEDGCGSGSCGCGNGGCGCGKENKK